MVSALARLRDSDPCVPVISFDSFASAMIDTRPSRPFPEPICGSIERKLADSGLLKEPMGSFPAHGGVFVAELQHPSVLPY
jgi:hypothetical protein